MVDPRPDHDSSRPELDRRDPIRVESSPEARRDWRALLVATFAIGFSNSVIFAVLADLQDLHGFGDAGLGVIAATGFVVSLVAQLVIAPRADRGGSARVLRAGLALAVAGSVAFALASSLWAFVAARALVGVSVGTFLPAARARAVLISPERRGERLGRLASVELAGFVGGPFLGGLIVDPLGVRTTFLLFGGVALAALLALRGGSDPAKSSVDAETERAMGPSTRVTRHADTTTRPGLGWDLLAHRGILAGTVFAAAMFVPVGVFDALWDRYLTDLGASNALIGVSFAMFGIPFVALATTGGRLAERVGPRRCLLAAAAVLAPLIAIYGVLDAVIVIVVLGALEGAAQAVAAPAAQLMVAAATPPGREAAAQGLAGAAQLAIAGLVAAAAAPVYSALGPLAVFVGAATVVVVLVLLATALGREPDRELGLTPDSLAS